MHKCLILCLNPPLLMTVCLLSVTHSKADLKWEKGDNAIYAEPSVAGFPIKYRSKKKKKRRRRKEIKLRTVRW